MSMPVGGKSRMLTVRLPDEGSLQKVKTIMAYEAALRDRQLGQTLFELVMESANVDSYPEEMRERIAQFNERIMRQSIEKAFKDRGASAKA